VKVDREVRDRLHADVCAGDPTAWSRVFTTLLDPLVDWLGFRWPDRRDSEQLHDFAVDSIMSYLQAPGRYDPTKSSLLSYLCMDAHGDCSTSTPACDVTAKQSTRSLSKSPSSSGRELSTSIRLTVNCL
jgi:hypothetical protein